MCEGVSEGSRHESGWVTFSSISCRHLSRNIYVLLECLVCHCMSTYVGSKPCRIIPLWVLLTLSRENLFQVLKVHMGMGRIRGLRDKEMAIYGLVM